MPASPLNPSPNTPKSFEALLSAAQGHLDEVHAMLLMGAESVQMHRTACPFAIADSLISLVSGFSTVVYRSTLKPGNSGHRFRRLLLEHYPWESEPADGIGKERGPGLLYDAFRNPGSHALRLSTVNEGGLWRMEAPGSVDRKIWVVRQLPRGVESWSEESLLQIEQSQTWPDSLFLATLSEESKRDKTNIRLSVDALHWGVRRLIESLTHSPKRMEVAAWFLREHEGVPQVDG